MTQTMDASPRARTVVTDPTTGFRRVAGAVALPLAFVLQLATNTIYAWATRDGGGDTGSSEEAIEFYAAHPGEMLVASVVALVGCFLVVPGVLAALRVLRPTRPRLSLIAGSLMIAGYTTYFGIVFTNFLTLALARSGATESARILQDGQDGPVALSIFGIFVIGNIIGTLLLGLAVVLSKDLPWWSGALIIGWPVGHVVNIILVNEWFAVAGGALEIVGLVVVARAALRLSNPEWVARG